MDLIYLRFVSLSQNIYRETELEILLLVLAQISMHVGEDKA